jgi:colanic acid/amylovoran biosynthesis glycosyltransferase
MKIAYLMNQYPYASCTFIRREIFGVEACGHEVSRFSIRPPGHELTDEGDKQELPKTQFILHSGKIGLFLSLLKIIATRPLRFLAAWQQTLKIGWKSDRGLLVNLVYLVEACVLLEWCVKSKVEHIHAHFGSNPAAVAMLCHTLGGPSYSFTVHGPHEFDKPSEIALGEKIRHAAFVVAISSFTKGQLSRWCNYNQWSKIHVVHCGVDDLFLEHHNEPLPEAHRFVCVGRLDEQKGSLLLVEAASQLAVEGLKFKVIFVGDGPLRNQIQSLITTLNLQDHIEVAGWATNSQVQQHIINAQVMILPSFAEGLPVVIMEALALCRPVISTYIAGIPELVEEDKCGWLVPSGSVTELAAAMSKAIQTPVETLAQMGKLGAERVIKEHNAKLEASKLVKLFENYHQTL